MLLKVVAADVTEAKAIMAGMVALEKIMMDAA